MAGMMREEAAKLHEQIAVLLESAKQAQEKKTLQNAPVAAVHVVEIKQVGSRIELERAAMEREDAQSLCAEQQYFVRVCTIAEIRQQRQAKVIKEWAAEIQKWKTEDKENKTKKRSRS